MARQRGIGDLYLVGIEYNPWILTDGFDAQVAIGQGARLGAWNGIGRMRRYFRRLFGFPQNINLYKKTYMDFLIQDATHEHIHPCVVPNWDNSPRSGKNGHIYHKSTPELFRKQLNAAIRQVSNKSDESRFIFVKSWNEWAEGNHLEPDLKFGRRYLEVLREEIETNSL